MKYGRAVLPEIGNGMIQEVDFAGALTRLQDIRLELQQHPELLAGIHGQHVGHGQDRNSQRAV